MKWEQSLARGRSRPQPAPLLPVAPRRRGRPATPPPLGRLPAGLCNAIRALRPPPLLKGWNGLRRSRAHRPLGRSAPAWRPRRRARRDDAAAEIFGGTAARFRPLFCTGSRGAGGGARLRRGRAARHGLAGTRPPCGDGRHPAGRRSPTCRRTCPASSVEGMPSGSSEIERASRDLPGPTGGRMSREGARGMANGRSCPRSSACARGRDRPCRR